MNQPGIPNSAINDAAEEESAERTEAPAVSRREAIRELQFRRGLTNFVKALALFGGLLLVYFIGTQLN